MKTTRLQTIYSTVWYTDFTKPFFTFIMSYGFMEHPVYIQSVSGGTVNILGGGSMDYSE